MLEILRNNIRRDLYRNRVTYLLMGLLIAVGMYIASSLAAITYSYNLVCEQNYIDSNYQDGQFSLKKPLTDSEESSLEKQGYGLERNNLPVLETEGNQEQDDQQGDADRHEEILFDAGRIVDADGVYEGILIFDTC